MQSYMHMRCQAQQLDSYSSARHCSTARQLDSYLTDLDRPRQHSTPSLMESGRVRLDRLDRNSTVTRQARQARPRQRLDSASTVPRRSLDSSTARQPGLKRNLYLKSYTRDAGRCARAFQGYPRNGSRCTPDQIVCR